MRKKPESGNPNLERFALYKFIRRRKKRVLKTDSYGVQIIKVIRNVDFRNLVQKSAIFS